MTILSIKRFETPELRKLKAGIVFRGDGIRNEASNLAVLQEPKVNPTEIVGIYFNLAYGAMVGNCSTQSDVMKAYTVRLEYEGTHRHSSRVLSGPVSDCDSPYMGIQNRDFIGTKGSNKS